MQKTNRLQVLILISSLIYSNLHSVIAQAQIIADKNAPQNQQPTILTAPNGTPLVNIQTPNAHGVSRNTYQQLDVNKQGAILNNSRSSTKTQLGGWVEANPWLNKNEARVILNEVNSHNPSLLNGFVEVAGKNAAVIIANPSGITVNGGGFINSHQVTLTTGRYAPDDAQLHNLNVQKGKIVINGQGLNNTNSDYTKILSQALEVNAELWANDLYVGLGNNQYNTKTTNTTPLDNATNKTTQPQIALDVSQLGGMYAGKIKLVGTQAGLGVNNQGYIGASAGNLELTIDGQLVNKGQIIAQAPESSSTNQQNIHIKSQSINNQGGTIAANENITLEAKNNISNIQAGVISAQQNLSLTSENNIYSSQDAAYTAKSINLHAKEKVQSSGLHASEHLNIQAKQVDLNSSQIQAQQIQITSTNEDLKLSNSHIQSKNLNLNTPTTLHTDSAFISTENLTINAKGINNKDGYIEQTSQNNLKIELTKELHNKGGSIITAGELNISSQNINNAEGQIAAEQNLILTSDTDLNNNQGVIASTQSDTYINANKNINNSGTISAADNLKITTNNLDNSGVLHSSKNIEIKANNANNSSSGSLVADQSLVLESNELNNYGIINAAYSKLKAIVLNNYGQGKIYSDNLYVQSKTVNNSSEIKAKSKIDINAEELLINTNGEIVTTGDLNITSKNINNTEGQIAAEQNLILNSSADLNNNQGIIASTQASAHINTNQTLSNSGTISAADNLKVLTNNLDNSGTLSSSKNIEIKATNVNNSNSGSLIADQNLTLSANTLNNRGLIDATNSHLNADTLNNLGAGRIYGNNLAIQAKNLTNTAENNQAATLAAREQMNLGVNKLTNSGGAYIFSGDKLNLGSSLNENLQAQGEAQQVINQDSLIESLGSMRLSVRDLSNLNTGFSTQLIIVDTERGTYIKKDGTSDKIPLNELVWESWSRAGQYRYKTDAATEYNGIFGESPIPNYRECIAPVTGDADCPSNSIAPGSDYQPQDAIWANLKVAPPKNAPKPPSIAQPQAPTTDSPQEQQDYLTELEKYEQAIATYQQQLIAWEQEIQVNYDALDEAINKYNSQFASSKIRDWTEYKLTRTTKQDQVVNSTPAQILAGGDLHLASSGKLINDKSHIIAGGTLTGNLERLENLDAIGRRIVEEIGTAQHTYSKWRGGFKRYHQRRWDSVQDYKNTQQTSIQLNVAKQEQHTQKNSLDPKFSIPDAQSNTAYLPNNSWQEITTPQSNNIVRTQIPNISLPKASIYQHNSDPSAKYFVETDPRFANYKNWLSSDYLLENLQFDHDLTQKRLGDGYYEQRLIREQINQLTGQNFLGDYRNEEEQYQALMNSGLNFAQEYQLIPGVALSAEQMANLTEDLVWLVNQEITLDDGSVQTVLVPQLYALIEPHNADGSSATIAGQNINLNVQGNLDNSGTLLAKNDLQINADNLNNLGGTIQGQDVSLATEQDLINKGGTIYAGNSLDINAQGDLVIASTTGQSTSKDSNTHLINTWVDKVAEVIIGSNATGNLNLNAGQNLEVTGANITNNSNQTLNLSAQDNLIFGTLALEQQEHLLQDSNNYKKSNQVTHQGSNLNSQGTVNLSSGENMHLVAADLNSEADINLTANNINISAQVDTRTLDEKYRNTTSSRVHKDTYQATQQQANSTNLSGSNININANGTVQITGSNLNAEQDLTVGSVKLEQQEDGSFTTLHGGNSPDNLIINTLELTNERYEEHSSELRGAVKTLAQVAAVAGPLIFPALGPMLGATSFDLGETNSYYTASTTNHNSTLNAGNNLVLAAQNNIHLTSGELNAGANTLLASEDITLTTAVNTHITETSHSKTTAAGLGVSVGKDEITLGGLELTKQTTTERTTTKNHQGTELNSENLFVLANNDLNFIGSQVNVNQDAVLQAGNNLTIEGRADSTTTDFYQETEVTTISAGVKNAYVDTALAADALVKAGEAVKQATKDFNDAKKRVKEGTLAASALDDYKANLAAATTQLAQAGLNLVASGATAAASTATAGFYVTGSAQTTVTEQQASTTNQTYQAANFNIGGSANINAAQNFNLIGSNLNVNDTLNLNADQINLIAGVTQNTSSSSDKTTSAGGSISTSAGGSFSANASHSNNQLTSQSTQHNNSQLIAGNLNSDSSTFNLAGANATVFNDLNLNTNNLNVTSLQDTSSSSGSGTSYSAGFGGGTSNPKDGGASLGFGKNSSSENSQWVSNQSTLIGGGNVNITTDTTTITGGVLANATYNPDGSLTDHGNLNLVTNELTINDLQDHSRSSSKGIDLNAGLSKNGTSSVGLQKGGHNTEQTTYATLGGGAVTKKSGEQHDLTNTNRDLNNSQEITLDQQTAGLNANLTVDHRLATQDGRAQIKEDLTKSGMLVDTALLVAITERVGILDFLNEVGQKHTTYEGIKAEIANDPELAKQLQNSDLTPEQKEMMLDQLTHKVMVDLGYSNEDYQNIIVANDKDYVQTTDGTLYERHGFYSEETQNAYINDAFIQNTKGLVTTAGHELSHALDDRSGNTYSQKDNEIYANQFGNNFGNYTNVALGATGNGSMANSNSHVGNDSQKVQTQTQSYNALDKNKGDNLAPILAAPPTWPVIGQAAIEATVVVTAIYSYFFGDDISPPVYETPVAPVNPDDIRNEGIQKVEESPTIYTTPEYRDDGFVYENIPEKPEIEQNSGGYQEENRTIIIYATQNNDNGSSVQNQSGRNHDKAVLTNSQAKKIAAQHGLRNVGQNAPNKVLEQVKGPVYYDKKTNSYYSPDKTGHRADNAWKRFDRNGNRETGYFDKSGNFIRVSE